MSSPNRPIHFLLVEDDEDHADLVSRAMRENRIANEIAIVGDGEAALRYLRNQAPFENAPRPHVILLDLKLPKIDGHEVLEQIKSDPGLKTIPVVVMTTSQAESDRARAYASHANSYLVKPLDFERFHEMILQLRLYWAAWNEPPVLPA